MRSVNPVGPRVPVRLLIVAWVAFWVILACGLFLGADQITYQAAGERLNAGHALYALSAGDRYIAPDPPYWSVPILYPPLIAVIWRPLAVLAPVGPVLWWLANAGALLAASGWIARRSRPLVVIAAVGIGITVASGNVGGLLVAGMTAAWEWRDDPRVGALVAVMAAVKVLPVTLLLWLVTTRRWRALAWATGAGAACVVLGMLAGPTTIFDYVGIARSAAPEPLSLAGLTGISPLIAAVVGGVAILMLPDRWSYRAAIATTILASPALGVGSLVSVLPLGAPYDAARSSSGKGF